MAFARLRCMDTVSISKENASNLSAAQAQAAAPVDFCSQTSVEGKYCRKRTDLVAQIENALAHDHGVPANAAMGENSVLSAQLQANAAGSPHFVALTEHEIGLPVG